MSEPIVGAQLYTTREFCKTIDGVAETLRKVARIGYTAIQVSAFGPVDPKDVARIAADNSLTIASTHTGWGRFLEDLDAVIEEHKIYGCRHPAIGGLSAEYRSLDGLKRFLDEIVPIAEALTKEGMDLSYHNHSHELARYGGKTWLEMLYEQGDPSHVKAEIDTYWIQAGGGDPALWIRKCAGREPLIHFKDMAVTSEREQRFAEIGEGNLNWETILDAVRTSHAEYVLVEQDKCYDHTPFESLEISYRNLKAMGLT